MRGTTEAALVSRNDKSKELNGKVNQFLIQTNELGTKLLQIYMAAVATCQKARGVCNVLRPCLGNRFRERNGYRDGMTKSRASKS